MLTAEQVKKMMYHKDDIIFGVISRCNHAIQAAALNGNGGIVFEYPAEYDGYKEIEVFYQTLDDFGYTVIDLDDEQSDDDEQHWIAIYWVG